MFTTTSPKVPQLQKVNTVTAMRKAFGTGGVDGIVGRKTVTAIAQWQQSRNSRTTGVLTRVQYRKLVN